MMEASLNAIVCMPRYYSEHTWQQWLLSEDLGKKCKPWDVVLYCNALCPLQSQKKNRETFADGLF